MQDKIAIIDQQSTTNDQRPDSCPQVSVFVLIYNGSWERVRATLNSVIMQKGIDFEVIVMDDCSKVNHSDRIKDFFSRHNFSNYRLIVHEKNLGTVATCLEAAQESKAEYTRGLGQGDMFFDEYALRDSYNYMVKTDAEVMVSQAVCYYAFSNPIEIFENHRYPQNIKAYNDPDELRESYLLHDDRVSGATVMFRREVFAAYMQEAVSEGMKYIEDFMIRCMVFDKRRIKFLDRDVIFYECGAGISNVKGKNTPHKTKAIAEAMDNDICINNIMLLERCKKYPSEFSDRLLALLTPLENRQKLKAKLGILSIPLVLLWRSLKDVKEKILLVTLKDFIKTNINVSTDFANLCINRE